MPETANCPFCEIAAGDAGNRVLLENGQGFVIRDAYPISPGHALIIPRRHVASFFDTTSEEKQALFMLLEQARDELGKEYSPAAWNVGINDGEAAGQTIFHCHIHLIPRYTGDVPDPRGGVRRLNPEKADYWSGQ